MSTWHVRSLCLLLFSAGFLSYAGQIHAQSGMTGGGQSGGTHQENPSSTPENLTVVGDNLFFVADDGIHGRELWMSDIEGRCSLAADLWPGPDSSNPRSLTNADGALYFMCNVPRNQIALWGWDAENGAPRIVEQELLTGTDHENIGIATWGAGTGLLYVFAKKPMHTMDLRVVRSGQFTAKTLTVLETGNVFPSGLGFLGELFIYRDAFGMGKTGGTIETTAHVSYVAFPHGSGTSGCVLGNQVLFMGQTDQHGAELWVCDATAAGTHLLRDVRPGPLSSAIAGLFRHGDAVYFQADDGRSGIELWKTVGITDGTSLLADINPGTASSDPHYFCGAGAWLYFVADDGIHGSELWKTDGTRDGTGMVKDLYPGPQGSGAWSLVEFRNKLYFCALDPINGEEIWLSDGTADDTQILKDIVPGPAKSGPDNLTPFKNKLFFTCNDGIHGEELWLSDGTPEGTSLAADIALPRLNPSSSPRHLTPVGDRIFFTAIDVEHGRELWTTDGTEGGTTLVRDIAPGLADADPEEFVPAEDRLFFSAQAPDTGRELWVSDGTLQGTMLVADLCPGVRGSSPEQVTALDQLVFFIADDGVHGRSLWRSDGTPQGTLRIQEPASAEEGIRVLNAFAFEQRIHVYVEQTHDRVGLWRVDSEARGFECLANWGPEDPSIDLDELLAENASVVLNPASGNASLQSQDTVILSAIFPPSIASCPVASRSRAPVRVGKYVYFVAYTRAQGSELWKTDGTVTGAQLVRDVFSGPASSSPDHLVPLGNTLYFVAEHPELGRVLWRTDEDEQTARVVRPLSGADTFPPISPIGVTASRDALFVVAPRPSRGQVGQFLLGRIGHKPDQNDLAIFDSQPNYRIFEELAVIGEKIFFAADDNIHGEELWSVMPSTTTPRLLKDILTPVEPLPRE